MTVYDCYRIVLTYSTENEHNDTNITKCEVEKIATKCRPKVLEGELETATAECGRDNRKFKPTR